MKLSEKIAYLRKEQGWSQEQLAIKLDVSRQAVYKWEADINQPDLDKLKKISLLFKVSFNDLMDDNIDISKSDSLVEVETKKEENEEIPKVEILENTFESQIPKAVHNEVAVQINYGKDTPKKPNKKLVATLCVFASVVVICLCALSYILFGIVLQKDSYLVKFDTQGGTTLTDLVIKEGKKIENLSAPSKDGYTFDGWYVGDKKWDFDLDKIKGNTTLTAKWTPNENTVTYIDYETGERFESKGKTDETIVLASNTFTKKGYLFGGWALSPNGEVVYTNCATLKMGTENITLYAVWQVDEYSLTLNSGNGKINDTYPEKFTSNDKVTLPIPTLTNYNFDGWYDENGKKYDSIPKGTVGDITLYAKYTPMSFNIYYVLNGGVNDENNPKSYIIGDDIVLLDPTKENTAFDGWYFNADFTVEADESSISKSGGHITLYAKWIDEKFEFAEVSGGVALIGYEGSSQKVVIPQEYSYYDVVEISAGAFSDCENMREVVIPATIQRINTFAFDDCLSLETITVDKGNATYSSIDGVLYNKSGTWLYKYPTGRENTVYIAPSSVDVIGPYAFAFAIFLEEVYLPNDSTLTYGIGKVCESAFDGCIGLTKIELGYIANYFEARCFRNCMSLESITFNAETVWGIAESAFENCLSLENVTFNCNSVKDISNYVFKGCVSLNTLDLTVVEKLGSNVFYEAGLMELYIPSTVTYIGNQIFFNCLYDELIVYCEAPSKPSNWAYNWSYGSYVVEWGVGNDEDTDDGLVIDGAKFYYVIIEDTVAITRCEGKGVVTIPDTIENLTVTSIYDGAFENQAEITEIILPSTISSIGKTAFDGCTALESFITNEGYAKVVSKNGVLYDDWGESILRYPIGKKDSEFIIPKDVDIIRAYAFRNNTHLTKIVFPSDVTGDNYVGRLEEGAFENCTGLTTVEGFAVDYLANDSFRNCSSLKEITFLAEEVYGIGNYSFYLCQSLEKVEFKGDVFEIGYRVFAYCTNLTSVNFEKTLGKLSMHTFENCIKLSKITLPEGLEVITSEAFKGCQNLTQINLPSTVTTIEDYAFISAPLQYFNIPSTVTTIEDYAFANIYDLFIFCEATEKPSGWSSKWNYNSNKTDATPYATYFGTLYEEPTFEFTVLEDGSTHITEIRNIKNKVLILPSMNGLSRVTHMSLNETDINGVEEIFLSNWFGSTVYSVDLTKYSDLKSVIVGHFNQNYTTVDGILYNDDKTELIFYPRSKEDEEYAVIKELKTIKENAFKGAKNLMAVVLYKDNYGVEIIENSAFSGCANLTSVDLGKSIREIGAYAFSDCALIKNIEFVNTKSLKIGNYAFYNCVSIESVSVLGISTDIGEYAFHKCENVNILKLYGVNKIYSYAFSCNNLSQVYVPMSIEHIYENAFDQCSNTTFYCEPQEKPSNWNSKWISNPAHAQILWGQEGPLDEE